MAEVGNERAIDKIGYEVGQQLGLAVEDLCIEGLIEAADDRLADQLLTLHTVREAEPAGLEERLEPSQRLVTARQRRASGREHLDDHEPRQAGLGGKHGGERTQRRRHPLGPLEIAGGVRAAHLGDKALRAQVVGGEEALLLVNKQVIERAPRDAGVTRDVLDRDRRIPLCRAHVDDRIDDPFALV